MTHEERADKVMKENSAIDLGSVGIAEQRREILVRNFNEVLWEERNRCAKFHCPWCRNGNEPIELKEYTPINPGSTYAIKGWVHKTMGGLTTCSAPEIRDGRTAK